MYNVENPNTHNRLVAGSNPAEPTKLQVLNGLTEVRELLELLIGQSMKRKLQLRALTNDKLFRQYDGELVFRHPVGKRLMRGQETSRALPRLSG